MSAKNDEMFDVWLANAKIAGTVGEMAEKIVRVEVDGLRAHIEWLQEQLADAKKNEVSAEEFGTTVKSETQTLQSYLDEIMNAGGVIGL